MDRAASITLGDMEIVSIDDGTLVASVDSILRLDPAEADRLVAEERIASGIDPLVLPVRAFVLRTPGGLALVDTGSGNTKGSTMGHLPRSLAQLGIAPAAIDFVLLTHVHMDHIGGLIDENGRPAFPNAELLLHRDEARYFLDTPEDRIDARSRRHLAFQRRAVEACAPRVRRVAEGEGLPGIVARLAPGHTPGHCCWEIASGGAKALVLGDVVHLAAVQLARPSSAMIYDVDPGQAAATRCEVLERVARENIVVAGAHLPGGGLGRISKAGDGYHFAPC